GPGKGQGAGDQPGVDYYEAEISVEELQEMLFAELELGITDDDLRFKTWEEIIKPHSNAVIVAMMGTSGSMGVFEKYIARSFFFWMVRFLRTKYEKVE
ncbi:DUF444 family protein, partial [Brevibacillus formosus]|uniref:DUF444 family protein n=1 Tax=Brevibacillus formosus TaxID=54913 RepID=UPI003D18FD64